MGGKGQTGFSTGAVTKWSIFEEQICSIYFEIPRYLEINIF